MQQQLAAPRGIAPHPVADHLRRDLVQRQISPRRTSSARRSSGMHARWSRHSPRGSPCRPAGGCGPNPGSEGRTASTGSRHHAISRPAVLHHAARLDLAPRAAKGCFRGASGGCAVERIAESPAGREGAVQFRLVIAGEERRTALADQDRAEEQFEEVAASGPLLRQRTKRAPVGIRRCPGRSRGIRRARGVVVVLPAVEIGKAENVIRSALPLRRRLSMTGDSASAAASRRSFARGDQLPVGIVCAHHAGEGPDVLLAFDLVGIALDDLAVRRRARPRSARRRSGR